MDKRKKIGITIKKDMIRLKQLLNKNPQSLIHNIFVSISSKTHKKYSAYEIDIVLAYLKQFYEKFFPETKKGGYLKRLKRTLQSEDLSDPKSLIYLPHSVNRKSFPFNHKTTNLQIFTQNISISARPIILAILEGIHGTIRIPNFVQVIATRLSMSKRTVYKYITRGTCILELDLPKDIILKYKNNKISSNVVSQVILDLKKIRDERKV